MEFAQKHNLDGVNFDFEDELEAGSDESKAYTRIFKQTVASLHKVIPNSQVCYDDVKTIDLMTMMTPGQY